MDNSLFYFEFYNASFNLVNLTRALFKSGEFINPGYHITLKFHNYSRLAIKSINRTDFGLKLIKCKNN